MGSNVFPEGAILPEFVPIGASSSSIERGVASSVQIARPVCAPTAHHKREITLYNVDH